MWEKKTKMTKRNMDADADESEFEDESVLENEEGEDKGEKGIK